MKKLILLSSLLLTSSSFALNFEDLHGCYKTIDVNGTARQHGPVDWRNQTLIEELGNRTYKDIETRKDISTSSLTIFEGFNDPYYRYNPFVMMHGKGEMIESENSFEYTVDEDFLMSSYGIYKKVDHYINIKMTEDELGVIHGRAQYISNIRKHNRSVNFTIQRQECF